MARFLFTFQFDGAKYFGWQRQAGEQPSVQSVAEAAFADLLGTPVNLVGASRTDRGVHARSFPAHADFETRLAPDELRRAIDARLPLDLALTGVRDVAPDFHCRYAAMGKCYAYRFHNSRRRSPLERRTSHFVPRLLDIGAMRDGARHLLGTHDFSSFATLLSEHPGKLTSQPDPLRPGKPEGNIRTLLGLHVVKAMERVTLLVFGDGFLRGMVRALAGTLMYAGLGKLAPNDIARILAARDRREAAANLPANGLTLEQVFYRQDELEEWLAAAASAEAGRGIRMTRSESCPVELLL